VHHAGPLSSSWPSRLGRAIPLTPSQRALLDRESFDSCADETSFDVVAVDVVEQYQAVRLAVRTGTVGSLAEGEV
jgi:hypothetical protein